MRGSRLGAGWVGLPRLAILAAFAPLVAQAAAHGAVEGTLTVTKRGAPALAKNAVLYLVGYETAPPKTPALMHQVGRMFSPPVLPVVKGQTVRFVNDEVDGVWHHVFSPPGQSRSGFDLGKFAAPEARKQEFFQLGRHDVFCDIHKDMIATILVVPNSGFVVLPEADGPKADFKIADVPPGALKLVAWRRGAASPVEVPVTVKSGETTRVEVALEEGETPLEALKHKRLHGKEYGPDAETAVREKEGWK
jgi:plastocyanin